MISHRTTSSPICANTVFVSFYFPSVWLKVAFKYKLPWLLGRNLLGTLLGCRDTFVRPNQRDSGVAMRTALRTGALSESRKGLIWEAVTEIPPSHLAYLPSFFTQFLTTGQKYGHGVFRRPLLRCTWEGTVIIGHLFWPYTFKLFCQIRSMSLWKAQGIRNWHSGLSSHSKQGTEWNNKTRTLDPRNRSSSGLLGALSVR